MAIASRRHNVAQLYLKGWTQVAIAEHLRVLQKTVCLDLKFVRQQWRDSMVRDYDMHREEELKKITLVEMEAWAGFERSQKPAQEARVKDGDQSKATKTMKSRTGDARFLDVVMKCIASRRELLGLDLAKPTIEIHNNGVQLADLLELRRKMLHEPDFVEYCRDRAIDVDARALCPLDQPGTVEAGPAPGIVGPGDYGHDPGVEPNSTADRHDATQAREERADQPLPAGLVRGDLS